MVMCELGEYQAFQSTLSVRRATNLADDLLSC